MIASKDDVALAIMKLSSITEGHFRHGVALRVLQESDPLVTVEDLDKLTPEGAHEILRHLWIDWGCLLLKDTKLADDVFVFAMVFGIDVAVWLLREAATATKVDRSYVMREPAKGYTSIDGSLAIKLSNIGQALQNFRLLTAGYIGWLNRIKEVD